MEGGIIVDIPSAEDYQKKYVRGIRSAEGMLQKSTPSAKNGLQAIRSMQLPVVTFGLVPEVSNNSVPGPGSSFGGGCRRGTRPGRRGR